MKICSKTHQIAPFKKISRGSMTRIPWQTLGYATRRKPLRGMQLAKPPKKLDRLGKSRIRLWTKIVAQHTLKCNTWALFSNTMCP